MQFRYLLVLVLSYMLMAQNAEGWFSRRRWIRTAATVAITAIVAGKREAGAHFKVKLNLNPCSFDAYDIDDDQMITEEEMIYMFTRNKETSDKDGLQVKEMFRSLDTQKEDGGITRAEFKASVSNVIEGC